MSVSNAENSDVSNYNHKEKANLCFDREWKTLIKQQSDRAEVEKRTSELKHKI